VRKGAQHTASFSRKTQEKILQATNPRHNCFLQVKFLLAVSARISGGVTLANIRSQIKRNRQNEKRRVHNRVYRGSSRTLVAKANTAIEKGDQDVAQKATLTAIRFLDRAAQKGVIHKNNAARRKGRLMKRLAKMAK
jgi:small subunit ribosomal protein S20